MVTVGVDGSRLQADSQPKSAGFVWGLAVAWRSVCIHWWWQRYNSVHTLV